MLPFTLDGAEFQTVVHQILIGCHLDRHPQEDDPHPHHQDDDPHLKVQTSIENSQAVTRSDSWICTNHCQQKIKICWVFGNGHGRPQIVATSTSFFNIYFTALN